MNELLVVALVYPFAVYGLAYSLRYLDGFMDVYKSFREFMGIKYIENGTETVEYIPDNLMFARLMGCLWCIATWLSLVMSTIVAVYFQNILAMPLFWFYGVGASGFLYDISNK